MARNHHVLATLTVAGLVFGCGSASQPRLNWTVDIQAVETTTLGGPDGVFVTVTNNGTAASNLDLYMNARDDWFKHHLITNPDGCTINTALERLDCGAFAAGATKTIKVVASPKDAGNFTFEVDVADEEGSNLLHPDKGSMTWNEVIHAF